MSDKRMSGREDEKVVIFSRAGEGTAIRAAPVFVVLLTTALAERKGRATVARQARVARRLGKPIVVLRVDEVPMPPELDGATVVRVGHDAARAARVMQEIEEGRVVGVVLPPRE